MIPTALNDPAGNYRILATECMTGSIAETYFRLTQPSGVPLREELTPFPPRASEAWPAPRMTTEEFLAALRRLRSIYEGTYRGLEAKYMLSYYLNVPFRPANRHAVARRLVQTDWRPHIPALIEAIRGGERFCLLEEDTGSSPNGIESTDAFCVGGYTRALVLLRSKPGARQRHVEKNGMSFLMVEYGKGALILKKDESVDSAAYRPSADSMWMDETAAISAYHSSDFAAWHEWLKKALKEIR